jgi:hypothetical protein
MASDEMTSKPVSDSQRPFAIDKMARLQFGEFGFRKGFGPKLKMTLRAVDLNDRKTTTRECNAVS